MDTAIQRLLPARITRESLLELFDQRASLASIKSWRYGWRGAPQWAIDLIRGKLAARAAADLAAGTKLRAGIGLSGGGKYHGAKALAAWREKKSRQKEATLQQSKENGD